MYNIYNLNKTFNVAIYCRLSKEDGEINESESINNQKLLLSKFVNENNWNLVDYYIDDGYTGVNFDRPNFKRMINDIENGVVDLVITKDLSRLGRDYITTGNYIEKYFPEKNIRYIALNDCIDTFSINNNNDITPFKTILNDMYSKDISKKVRSAILAKVSNGECIKAFPPYGYKKHPTIKGKLVIDDEIAPIIQKIFCMYYAGKNKSEIAKYLQTINIPTPLKYKELTCSYKNPNTNKKYMWGSSTITKILRDRIYIGDLVQHKYAKLNYKSKKTINIDIKDHIITPNSHKPIVSKDLFENVQIMLDKKSNEWNYRENGTIHLLRGLVYCGKCGSIVTYSKNHGKYFRGICSAYKKFGKDYCNNVSLREDYLITTVINHLKIIIKNYVEPNSLVIPKNPQKNISKEISTITQKINITNQCIKNIYNDKITGIISKETSKMLIEEYETEKHRLENQLEMIHTSITDKSKNNDLRNFIYKSLEFENTQIDRNLLLKLINKIEINNKNQITIYYNFKNKN